MVTHSPFVQHEVAVASPGSEFSELSGNRRRQDQVVPPRGWFDPMRETIEPGGVLRAHAGMKISNLQLAAVDLGDVPGGLRGARDLFRRESEMCCAVTRVQIGSGAVQGSRPQVGAFGQRWNWGVEQN